MEKPVQAMEKSNRQIRLIIQSRNEERTIVAKWIEVVPRKAAIVYVIPVP